MIKMTKKKIYAGLCAGLLLTGGTLANYTAFAATDTTEEKVVVNQTKEAREQQRAQHQSETEDLFTQYAPELLDQYKTLETELETLHEANKPQLDETARTALKTFMDSIKAKIDNGDMTKEEAQTAIKAYREENNIQLPTRLNSEKSQHPQMSDEAKTYLNSIKSKVDSGDMTKEEAQAARKAYFEENNIQNPDLSDHQKSGDHQAFDTAIQNKDAATIKELLEKRIDDMQNRLDDLNNN